MELIKVLHGFFQQNVEVDKKGRVHFVWLEGEDKVIFSADQWDDLTICWEKNGEEIFNVQSIGISNTIITDDECETSIQFVLERQPSRMFKAQLKPNLHISFELYYEICEDCDEDEL